MDDPNQIEPKHLEERRERVAACFPPWVRWVLGALLAVGIIVGAVAGGVLGARSTGKSSGGENVRSPPDTINDSPSDPEAMNVLLPANGSALALSAYEYPGGIVRTVYFQLSNNTLAYSTLHPNHSSTTGLLGLTADPLTPLAETNWPDENSPSTQEIRLYYLSSGVLTSAHHTSGTWYLGDLHSKDFKPASDSKLATTYWPGDLIVNRSEWVYYAQTDNKIAAIEHINNTWVHNSGSQPVLRVAPGSGLGTSQDVSDEHYRLWLFGQDGNFTATAYTVGGKSVWEPNVSVVYQPPAQGYPLAGNFAVTVTKGVNEVARLLWVGVEGRVMEVECVEGVWRGEAWKVEGVVGTKGAAVAAESIDRRNVRVYVVERKSGGIKEIVRGVGEKVWAEGKWKVGELDGG